jgi:MtN3 and saliva related transmembrane protein
MTMITAVGMAAGVLTTACWGPQLLRSWRTRSTLDISWFYLGALGGGVALWLTYGLLTSDRALVAANVATVTAVGTLGLFKLRFDRQSLSSPRRRSREQTTASP